MTPSSTSRSNTCTCSTGWRPAAHTRLPSQRRQQTSSCTRPAMRFPGDKVAGHILRRAAHERPPCPSARAGASTSCPTALLRVGHRVYCSGGGFLLSRHTVQALRQAARPAHTLFPIDDAFMGMCLERVGLKPSGHEGIRPFGCSCPAPSSHCDPCMYRELLLVHRFAPYEMLLMWKRRCTTQG